MLDGVLFFPVTPFAADGAVELGVLAEHLRRGLAAGPGGIFAACGTGEFHALAPEEYQEVVGTAVKEADRRVPVFAGCGGPLPTAIRLARLARDAGADGLLLMPPYLVAGPQAGLIAYTEAVAAATELPVIVYQRGSVVFDPASAVTVAALPTVVGFKDGLGDLDRLGQIVAAVGAAARTSRSSSSTGCRPPRRPCPPTGRSASSCTRRPRSASRPRCRWRSTER